MSQQTADLPVLLDSRLLREHYGLSESEVTRAWQHLATYRVGDARRVKVRRDEFEEWLESFRRPAHYGTGAT